MSKVSVIEMLPVLGALRRDNEPAMRVQLRESEGVDGLPASLARLLSGIDHRWGAFLSFGSRRSSLIRSHNALRLWREQLVKG